MKVYDAVRKMISDSNMSGYRVSKELGYETSYIASLLNSKRDMKVSSVVKIAQVCDHKLAIVPSNCVTDSMIVISSD